MYTPENAHSVELMPTEVEGPTLARVRRDRASDISVPPKHVLLVAPANAPATLIHQPVPNPASSPNRWHGCAEGAALRLADVQSVPSLSAGYAAVNKCCA
jgi:hypothetical protein